MARISTSRALYRSYTRWSPAACPAQSLHHEAWKRSTSTFLPMSARESKVSPPWSRGIRTAGAAGGGAAAGACCRARRARAAAARTRMTTHSIIAAMTDLERELRRAVEGDVRFDPYSRLLYSTDASMYQMEPIGVVIPRHRGRLQARAGAGEPGERRRPAAGRGHLAHRPDGQPGGRYGLLALDAG